MLEAETIREQHRPEPRASTAETSPVKVKKLGHVLFTVSVDKRQIQSKRFERLERHERVERSCYPQRIERLEQWFYFDPPVLV